MACHSDGWEEIAGTILHVDTLEGIGIIAHPKLVEATEHSPVGSTTTTRTALDNYIFIFGTDTVDNFGKSLMISDIEMTLECKNIKKSNTYQYFFDLFSGESRKGQEIDK